MASKTVNKFAAENVCAKCAKEEPAQEKTKLCREQDLYGQNVKLNRDLE